MNESVLTTGDVARRCQVTTMTVLNWIKAGRLKAYKTPGGHYRIRMDDFNAFVTQHDMPSETAGSSSEEKRILVVDDEPRVINAVLRILRNGFPEFEFAVAMDGYDAGFQVATFKPDLILLDIRMPGMDGVEVCRKIKTSPETTGIRILAMTAFPEEEMIQRMLDCGAEDYLGKPFGAAELTAKISSLVGEVDLDEQRAG